MPNNPEFSNQLLGEKSPYLLQHAHNPVSWYPWGNIAFEKAIKEDRPILLSVGYSTCHWCHVMAHESFEDMEIAKIINENFIAIKVDREERPDIDHIYMTATTAMTGQGGWPLTVFLTPQGDPFYGGTYFPPYAKWGSIGFIDLLNSIASGWKADRENVLLSGASISENLRQREKSSNSQEYLDEALLHQAFRQVSGQYDLHHGGFGSSPKFPMGHNLSFLLRYYKTYQSKEALTMVQGTLNAMANGGIRDHLGGGFHRYSTDQFWHVPHFEKMLYDQALLSRAYLEGYQVTGSGLFAQIAGECLNYVLENLTDPQGGFYSAQDADSFNESHGHITEGAFYIFTQEEIEKTLGNDAAAVFNYCYGVLPQGNASFDPHGEFIGRNILYQANTIEKAARHFGQGVDQVQDIIHVSKERLFSLRLKRPAPFTDDKVLCDWNGLMISSLAFAGRVLGQSSYTQAASKAADFILSEMIEDGYLLHRWRQGEAGIQATLEDYAFFIYGLLDLYEATFNDEYLKSSKLLADRMLSLFSDTAGAFFMTASDSERLILRPKEVYDGALPSGNSVAALILLRLYDLTKDDIYFKQAEALFKFFSGAVARAPHAHCFLLSALDLYLQGAMEISFEGEDSSVAKMLKVLYKYFIPNKSLRIIPSMDLAQAHICHRRTCRAPIKDIGEFENAIGR